ncbi:MAG: helix-turn-helix domain-containing protein [Burkholderiales bacterium]
MATFSDRLKEARASDSYWVETAKLDFALEFTRHMKEQGVSKSEMAKRLKTSPAYITKLLRGDANLTIESMVKAARALNCDFHTHIAHRNASVRWVDVHVNENQMSKPNPEGLSWAKYVREPNREHPAAA